MSSLRSFSGSTSSAAAVIFDHPVNLVSLDGIVGAAGYLMLFDTATVPVNGATPTITIQVSAAGPAPGISNPQGVTTFRRGMAVALSSTNTTLTILATTHSYWGQVEDWEYNVADEATITADNPNANTSDSEALWTDPNTNGYRLLTVKATNSVASPRRLMMFAVHDPPAGAVPISSWPVPASGVINLHFGEHGQEVFFYPTGFTKRSGCFFFWSSTATTLTPTLGEANIVQATYRTP